MNVRRAASQGPEGVAPTARRRVRAPIVLALSILMLGSSCGGGTSAASAAHIGASAPLAVESVDHEACNTTPGSGRKVEESATRADGKAVVTKVFDSGGHEVCRVTDINHDGKPDLYEYFDSSGTIRRRESDYDSNGTVDSVEFYEGGKLVKREYDTTGQHRVDTWDYFDKDTGKRTRRERDTTNDGQVDQWWTWDGDRISIAMDKTGDGKPDPGATVVMDDKTGEAVKDAKPVASSPASSSAPIDPNAPPPPALPSASPASATSAAPANSATAAKAAAP